MRILQSRCPFVVGYKGCFWLAASDLEFCLRGVLKVSWQLGLVSDEDYRRGAAVGNIKGETLLAGRSIASGELQALMDSWTGLLLEDLNPGFSSCLYPKAVRSNIEG